jgi:RelA/SpoT family protein
MSLTNVKLPESSNAELARLEEVWHSVTCTLTEMFEQGAISARLRPDVYQTGNGLVARDSAGVRVIVDRRATLDEGVQRVMARWPLSEMRDYRQGHPRAAYYRGVHIFVRHDAYEVEVQLRTERQHLIAAWAHDHLLPPILPENQDLVEDLSVGKFLSDLSEYYDRCDRGVLDSNPPNVPSVLRSHAADLIVPCVRPKTS